MKERPIIMNTENVKAILDGKKAQARRVIKPQFKRLLSIYNDCSIETESIFRSGRQRIRCPYGQVGDRLWVRETWAIKGCGSRVSLDKETWSEGFPVERLQYIATDVAPIPPELADDSKTPYWWNKRPSIFMPRWASRITLEITEVRVERVQEARLGDRIAEGYPYNFCPDEDVFQWFKDLWDSLNAKRGYGWDTNPWVWVISFKRLSNANL